MQTDDLLKNYAKASDKLFSSIASENEQLISQADQEITAKFNDIIKHTPRTSQGAIALTDGLLDILYGKTKDSELYEAIRNKIISMIHHSGLK